MQEKLEKKNFSTQFGKMSENYVLRESCIQIYISISSACLIAILHNEMVLKLIR